MNLKKEKYLLLFLFLIIYLKKGQAQDPYFSQNLNTRTYLNPAIAGTDSTLVASLGYRSQEWNSILHFSADQYIRFLRGGIGIDVINDSYEAGFLNMKSNYINLSYAPHFELFNHKLSLQPAFNIGYLKTTTSYNFTAPNTFSNSGIPLDTSIRKFDFSTGIFMYTNKFYGGLGIFHLTQPDMGFTTYNQLPYKLTINAGANLSSNRVQKPKFIISPNIIFTRQGAYDNLLLGITTKIKWLVLGAMYRNRDTYIFNAGLQFKYFKFGYSYEMAISQLTNSIYGSHEVHLIGFIPYTKKPCKIKTIRFI